MPRHFHAEKWTAFRRGHNGRWDAIRAAAAPYLRLQALTRSLDNRPDDPAIWVERGLLLYRDLGEVERAIADFSRAIDLAPNDPRRPWWHLHRSFALGSLNDRFSRSVRSIDLWCQASRHRPLAEQQAKLNEKLRGHYAYYGVTGNSGSLARFVHEVGRRWCKWLNRRDRLRSMTWAKFRDILCRFPLAPVRTVRSLYRHAAKP